MGATKRNIEAHFLAEAMIVGVPGAAIGAAAGVMARPPDGLTLTAASACILAGVVGAIVPAARAARMPPGAAVRPL